MTTRQRITSVERSALFGVVLAIVLLSARATLAFAGPASDQHGARTRATAPVHAAYALPRLLLSPAGAVSVSAASSPPGNFPFQSARSADGLIVLHYYREPTTFAQQFIALAQSDLVHPIHDTLGFSLKRTVNIYVYASRADFLAGAPVTDAAETGALADPSTSSIYLVSGSAQDDGATDALPHELTHIVFYQNEESGHLEGLFFSLFPVWLDEGLAAYDEPASSAQVQDYNATLHQATDTNALVDLLRDFNTSYPQNPGTDFLAYAEARSFITYLVTIYGAETFHRFLAGVRDGDLNFNALTTFDADLRLLQSRWESSLGLQPAVADQGFAPLVPPAHAVHPGTLVGLASATHAFLVWNGDMIAVNWLIAAILLLLWGMFFLVRDMRRSRWTPRMHPAPDPLPLPLRAPEAVPGIVPPLESYLDALRADIRPPSLSPRPPTTPVGVATAPAIIRLTPPPRPRWFDAPLLVLPLLLAVGAAALHIWLDPLHMWFAGYLSAALVGLAFLVVFIGLEISGRLKRRVVRVRRVGMLVAVVVIIGAGLSAVPIGQAQAHDYEARGAYALALRFYADAGESQQDAQDDMIRVQVEWAQAAAAVGDYATTAAHLRAAIALGATGTPSATSRVLLGSETYALAQELIAAGEYAQAEQAYDDELGSPTCDPDCAVTLKEDRDTLYITWARQLAAGGDYTAAAAKLQLAATDVSNSASATIARQDMLEVQATQALGSALAAGAGGNAGSMNTQLRDLITRYPKTAAASEASEIPQPVTGSVADARGVSVAGDLLFFLAFTSAGPAQRFNFDFGHDTSAFKVATAIGPGGAFSVRLPPGYWYVACWDDPTMAFNSYFNAPLASGNDAFAVQPFTPTNVGLILGY